MRSGSPRDFFFLGIKIDRKNAIIVFLFMLNYKLFRKLSLLGHLGRIFFLSPFLTSL